MIALRVKGVKQHGNSRCVCGKAKFYTEDAARFALNRAIRERPNVVKKECRYYECWGHPGVWHLTSMTTEQHQRRARAWALATIDRWGTPKTMTVRVRPGCQRSIPNKLRVLVIWRSA